MAVLGTGSDERQFLSLTELECTICNCAFEPDGDHQPKILKCGHTICRECLAKMVKEVGIKCPYCFAITPVGIMGIYALPVNVDLVTLVERMDIRNAANTRVAMEDLCCACRDKKAVKICFSCDPVGCKLCEACCTSEHERDFAPIRAHRPILIRDAPNTHSDKCPIHNSQPLTHYSKKTGTFACQQCLDSLTENIGYQPIEQCTHSFKSQLKPIIEKLERYLERVQDSHHKISIMQSKLRQAGPKAIHDFQTQFAGFQLIFKERQKTLLDKAEAYISLRKDTLGAQLTELRTVTDTVRNQKQKLRDLMEQNDKDFLVKYHDTFQSACELLDAEIPALQRPVFEAEMSIYIPDNFTKYLSTIGSVGGGPFVINCMAQMHMGLLRLTWNTEETEHPIQQYEIEYQLIPVSLDSDGPISFKIHGHAFCCFINCLCPGYTYTFRMRSSIFSGWGMWTKPFTGRFDDFPCTLSFVGQIVKVKLPTTGRYRITAKGAKAADGKNCRGGRGAIISAEFTLREGDVLDILCGGKSHCQGYHSGGGGGTFVSVNTREFEALLVVAGGGGGTRGYNHEDPDGCDASLDPHGTVVENGPNCAESGRDGAPGRDATFAGPPWGYGGAGWKESSTTAQSFVDSGNGGECGGFGGGGGVGMYGGGGGGGFSGGGGGRGGGGGGSYIRKDGDNIVKEIGNMGHGEVKIERISSGLIVVSPTGSSSTSSSARSTTEY